VSLTVTDTGPGIQAEDLDRIFVPFERLGAEQTGIEGNGIEVVTRFLKSRRNVFLRSVRTGEAGLAAAAHDRPDLILLDMHLPDLSGEVVLRHLQSEPATADIPVAVLSAEAAPGVIRRMRASGAAAYLTKPLDLAELGHLIHSFRAGGHSDAIPGTTSR
jgi:CheY-like chemotaxis protein